MKIRTHKQMMQHLNQLRRMGYRFTLVHGHVYWESPQLSLWTPVELVCKVFMLPDGAPWLQNVDSCERVGLPVKKYRELMRASTKTHGYHRGLRKRLLKACGLQEVKK